MAKDMVVVGEVGLGACRLRFRLPFDTAGHAMHHSGSTALCKIAVGPLFIQLRLGQSETPDIAGRQFVGHR
jgi:hypothetical protein